MSKPSRKSASPPRKSEPQQGAPAASKWLTDVAIWIALLVAILVVYAQVAGFDYTSYDDPTYVADNPQVQSGLTAGGIKYAFTSVISANWAPLTTLSHMLDCQIFGMDAGPHHEMNVLFHILASWMLLLALQRATGARWPSAFVAFAFALHPLHVESVAWVAERKDVLSAFFGFLALYAYVRYTESPNWKRYLLVALPFALGLLAKSMLVTFPFVLLLFDAWPLRRKLEWKLVWEKLPLFAISAAASVVTYLSQESFGAMSVKVPLGERIATALVAYTTYLEQLVWPARLAVFYALPSAVPVIPAGCSLVVLLAISGLVIWQWRSRPYLATGWFWYLGTLVPVIGLVQVGLQSHADRYTYIPSVGLFWMLAWGALDAVQQWPQAKLALASGAVAACVVWTGMSVVQTGYWRDGISVFEHAVAVTDDTKWARIVLAGAHYTVGIKMANSGRGQDAIEHFRAALRARPNYPEVENNLGIELAKTPGHGAEAIQHFEAALSEDPKLAQAHQNLGILLVGTPGREAEGLSHLEMALTLKPDPGLAQMIARIKAGGKP